MQYALSRDASLGFPQLNAARLLSRCHVPCGIWEMFGEG
jgi:hypothetical protein